MRERLCRLVLLSYLVGGGVVVPAGAGVGDLGSWNVQKPVVRFACQPLLPLLLAVLFLLGATTVVAAVAVAVVSGFQVLMSK